MGNQEFNWKDCTCVHKYRNNSNIIKGYVLEDSNGNREEIDGASLKQSIKMGYVKVTNLKLTSDNKLIDDKGEIDITDPSRYSKSDAELVDELVVKLNLLSGNIFLKDDKDKNNFRVATYRLMEAEDVDEYIKKMKYGRNIWKDVNWYNWINFRIWCNKRALEDIENTNIKGKSLVDYHVVTYGVDSADGRGDTQFEVDEIINNRLDKAEILIYKASKEFTGYALDNMKSKEFNYITQWIIAILIWYTLQETMATKAESRNKDLLRNNIIQNCMLRVGRNEQSAKFIERVVKQVLAGDVCLDKHEYGGDILIERNLDQIEGNQAFLPKKFQDAYKKKGVSSLMGMFKRK